MNALSAIEPQTAANAEAEALLLSSLMFDNRMIDGVADMLSAEDFSEPFYGHVFSLVVQMHSSGGAPNPVTLKPHLDEDGYKAVAGLTGSGAQMMAAKPLAEQIRAFSQRRRLIDGLTEALAAARSLDTGLDEAKSIAETALTNAEETDSNVIEITAAQAASEAIDELSRRIEGVTCGIEPIDEVLGQPEAGDQVIVAGRSGMGKTAVGLSYGLGAAHNGHGVLYISLEMGAKQLAKRLLAEMCFNGQGGVPYGAIVSRNLTDNQKRALARAAEDLRDLPLQIIDASSLTTSNLNRIVRRWKRRFLARGQKLELVVIDYLQLVRSDAREKDLYTRITEVSKALKAGAKANEVAYMTLAQLSRDVEKREDKRPQLSDLRDSGQIEQDADVVMFLLRPEYYLKKKEPEAETAKYAEWLEQMKDAHGVIEFIVAKHRTLGDSFSKGHFWTAYQAVRA